MANIFDNIMKGISDFGKAGEDMSRKYQYGPYYKENQDMAMKKAKADLKVAKSRKAYNKAHQAYWEKRPAFSPDEMSKSLMAIENVGMEAQSVMGAAQDVLDDPKATEEKKAEAKKRYDTAKERFSESEDATSEILGYFSDMNKEGPEVMEDMEGEMGDARKGKGKGKGKKYQNRTGSVWEGALGALANMGVEGSMEKSRGGYQETGPPQPLNTMFSRPQHQPGGFQNTARPVGIPQSYGAIGAGSGYLKGPTPQAQQTTPLNALGNMTAPTVQPKQKPGTPVITNEFDFYAPKLDTESKAELQQIISGRNQDAINIALQRLRAKYGPVK